MAVTAQPSTWKNELFSCMEDKPICIKATICPCLTVCEIADDMEEPKLGALCFSGVLRTKYRTQQNIPGNVCKDCIDNSIFGCCSLIQLRRDVAATKAEGTLNNMAIERS